MRYVLIVLAMALGGIATAEAQIYRCTAPDGAKTFSDKPCGADASVVDVEPATGRANAADAQAADERRARLLERAARLEAEKAREREQRQAAAAAAEARPARSAPGIAQCPPEKAYEDAIRRNEVLLCMTKAEVERAERMKYDNPNVSSVLLATGIAVEEWFYQRRYATWPKVIWFREGKVTAIQ